MEIIFYTRETAPHRPVHHGKESRYEQEKGDPPPCPSELHSTLWDDKHGSTAKPEFEGCTCYGSCAACNWDWHAPERSKRRAMVRAYQRTGKLPADWLKPTGPWAGMLKYKPLTTVEAKRVVLPGCSNHKAKGCKCQRRTWKEVVATLDRPEDREMHDARARYLEAMGFKSKKPKGTGPAIWTCGCTDYQACAHHKWALEGREED